MFTSSETPLSHHVPILLENIANFLVEGLRALPPSAPKGVILDCTLGGGGHTAAILNKMSAEPALLKHCVVGIDRDIEAIARDEIRFADELNRGLIEIVHAPFSQALQAVKGRPIYGLLADLGISSDQIDSKERGFSFRFPAPLDMRMNTTSGASLAEYLEDVSESELSEVLWKYGEERNSRKIARRLIDLRSKNQLPRTSSDLAEAISQTFPPAMRYKGIHPATRSFQALRIAINQEMQELETLISQVFPTVERGGRLAILSFHSLEDRPVKEALRNSEFYELPTRKAIQAGEDEVEKNPRSRSAKLRLAIRK